MIYKSLHHVSTTIPTTHRNEYIFCSTVGFNTKLSSAGLVYKHYGEEIVAKLMGRSTGDPAVATIYLAVYKNFMQAIDAIDNGKPQTLE